MAIYNQPLLVKAGNQGAIERRDPLPAGRYWVYIDDEEVDAWQDWVSKSDGKVKTLIMEPQKEVARWLPAVFATRPELFILQSITGPIIQSVAGYWVLFDVLTPVIWIGFGYPTTVIDPTIRSATDVASTPPPDPDPYSGLRNLVFTAGLFWLASSWLSRKR